MTLVLLELENDDVMCCLCKMSKNFRSFFFSAQKLLRAPMATGVGNVDVVFVNSVHAASKGVIRNCG